MWEVSTETVSYTHLDVYKRQLLVLSQDKERIKREEGRTIGAVKEIEGLLGLDVYKRQAISSISLCSMTSRGIKGVPE